MKAKKIFLGLTPFILLIGCANGADKFLGKWHKMASKDTATLIVEKASNHYCLYPLGQKNEHNTNLLYDKKNDRLIFREDSGTEHPYGLSYLKESGHLLLGYGTQNSSIKMELEKVEK